MMEALRQWLTGIVCVSVLLYLVRTLAPKGTVGRVAEFTGGLLLILTLLQPLGRLNGDWEVDLSGLQREMEQRQAELEDHREAVIGEAIEEYRSDMEAEGQDDT